jgi:hypothetical protein
MLASNVVRSLRERVVAEALMSAVYCPKCFRLRSDRTSRCSSCGHLLPSPSYLVVGVLVVSTMVGACATTLYAAFLSRAWDWWVSKFSAPEMLNEVAEKKAVEGAILLGIAVFLVTTSVTALIFGAGQHRRRRKHRTSAPVRRGPQMTRMKTGSD